MLLMNGKTCGTVKSFGSEDGVEDAKALDEVVLLVTFESLAEVGIAFNA
jgi:hypothetical protein